MPISLLKASPRTIGPLIHRLRGGRSFGFSNRAKNFCLLCFNKFGGVQFLKVFFSKGPKRWLCEAGIDSNLDSKWLHTVLLSSHMKSKFFLRNTQAIR